MSSQIHTVFSFVQQVTLDVVNNVPLPLSTIFSPELH